MAISNHRERKRSTDMDGLFAAFVIVASFVVLAVLAAGFGVDSRSTYADDWSR
jgi:hypothetical protein